MKNCSSLEKKMEMKNSMKMKQLLAIAVLLLLHQTYAGQSLDEEDVKGCKESVTGSYNPAAYGEVPIADKDNVNVAANLEYLEAEFFLWGAFGYGLDKAYPELTGGGPPPLGAQQAHLDDFFRDIIAQFAYQEVGHLRAIKAALGGYTIPRPQLDLSKKTWSTLINNAVGRELDPPFDPYANSLNYLLASYAIPYVGLTGYVGANPLLQAAGSRRLVAGLLGVESGQDALIRGYLYQRKDSRVEPYTFTVAEATASISALRSRLAHAEGADDEGLVVPKCLGAEKQVTGNALVGDSYSVSFGRNPEQIFSLVYGSGKAGCPGGFYPHGGNGAIAKSLLSHKVECS